jgi:GNAT superfamily N-acetyltransferase
MATHDLTRQTPATRKASLHELTAVAGMRRDMILELDEIDYDAAYPGWRDRFVTFFTGHQQAGRGQLFVAELDGEYVGTSAVYLMPTHRSEITLQRSAYICNVYVVPKWRRRGLARALTQAAVAWARDSGCEVVRLRTSKMGRPVYESLGFQRTDELELRL